MSKVIIRQEAESLSSQRKIIRRIKQFEKRLFNAYPDTGLRRPEIIGTVYFRGLPLPFYMLKTDNPVKKPKVCIRAGAHGEEYHGVDSLLLLLERDKELLRKYNAHIFPMGNPRAFVSRTREEESNRCFAQRYPIKLYMERAGMVKIINPPLEVGIIQESMDQRYHLAVDLHGEDGLSSFFCCQRKRKKVPPLAERLTEQMLDCKFPVYKGNDVDGRKGQNGVFQTNRVTEHTFEEYDILWGLKAPVSLRLNPLPKQFHDVRLDFLHIH